MGDVVHIGKRSWWDSTVTTLCGLKFAKDNNTRQMFARGNLCPACEAAKKGGRK
ncbi:hypothetical protein [Actinokineospora terrae]|uniref:Uncharacterized protein n=1 Tax=Actinokineospora terrae TaxID=155974 RepID=A0A1H9VFZ8_9PSEU|nr:hypothetical protein [Actinokineospora terrae]SES20710.1 hypothetical protein SAMN04487818_108346 [Actinokineospora terrae]